MLKGNRLFGALMLLGIAVLGAYYASQVQPGAGAALAQAATEREGPILEIDVAGEAEGTIRIKLFADVAPAHVERIAALTESGAYDNVVFHRVVDGFMAQSGDVEFGKAGGDTGRAGMGSSDLPDLPAEFSDLPFQRGTVGMARSNNPDSANSQFFIMFAPAPHLDGQYTVVGQVIEGMDVLDAIKRGTGRNGEVAGAPDVMADVSLVK